MNTSKQVNIMIGLLFLSVVVFGAYIAWEPTRSSDAEDNQAELFADRGAVLFINNCRGCHGMEGEGHIAPALATNAFLILGEDNEFGLEPTADGEADGIRSFLHNTISCGRTGSFMPVWAQEQGGALSRIQIDYLVELITSGRWDVVAKDALHHDLEVNELAPKLGLFADLRAGALTVEEAAAELEALGAPELAAQTAILEQLFAKTLTLTTAIEAFAEVGLGDQAEAFGRGIYGRLVAGVISAEEATAEWVALGQSDGGIYLAHEEHLLNDEQLHEIFSAQALVDSADVPNLSITTSNCGQYNAAALTEFRSRDPLVATPPPTDGTAEPTATSTPDGDGGGGQHPSEDAIVGTNASGPLPVREFFANNCAVCHGLNREGGVGLPLTRDRLTEPDQFYIDTITNGRGAIMPAWGPQGLDEDEIASIVTWLKNTDP
jgi:mono/diheme cytochrome c family protein